jgi:hypothetical protein
VVEHHKAMFCPLRGCGFEGYWLPWVETAVINITPFSFADRWFRVIGKGKTDIYKPYFQYFNLSSPRKKPPPEYLINLLFLMYPDNFPKMEK